jgi:hypothetical protein
MELSVQDIADLTESRVQIEMVDGRPMPMSIPERSEDVRP